LNDILTVGYALLEHFEEIVHDEIYESLAKVGSVDAGEEAFQKLHRTGIDS